MASAARRGVMALALSVPASASAWEAMGTVMVRSAERSPPPVARPAAETLRALGAAWAAMAWAVRSGVIVVALSVPASASD